MAEVRGLGLLEDIRRRRKEARQMGRLIHPEPLITEIRKKKRIKVQLLALKRAGDFVEGVAATLRDPATWQSGVASVIVSRVLSMVLPI
jgi:hypothetical protein